MRSLIVAPHPDDELLGCGGTLLRRNAEGGKVAWLIMTAMTENAGWSLAHIQRRKTEIECVREGLSILPNHLYELQFPAAELDRFVMGELIRRISEVFRDFQPEEVFLPYPGDVHSDHRVTFEAASACTKRFRYSSVRRVLAYETLSETEFGIDPRDKGFKPNFFIDISQYFERKLELMQIYETEMGEFPFPRSEESLTALARLRGLQVGCAAAEAFMLLMDVE
jgi:N-acetylglucosamine malate deacetylase 1